jgi:molybdate transport system ATP-binding protein
LHVIAGLLRPDGGMVRVGEAVLTDTAAGVFVPAHSRRIALLLQDPLLFPHLSVAANVAFAPRSRGRGRRAARDAARHWLIRVDAVELSDRSPRSLSGGQAQRVAIARALAAEPDVLLLDEPLAGLDVAAAGAVRSLLRSVLAEEGRAAIIVTHDVLDVLTLADRVVVLECGRVVEDAAASRVLAAPRSSFAAQVAGVNLVSGVAQPDGALVTADGTTWHGVGDHPPVGGKAVAVFSPSAVAVYRDVPHGSPRNTVRITVAQLEPRGPGVRVRAVDQVDGAPGLAADITAAAAVELDLAVGERVYFAVKAQEIAIHLA